jgi:hypothetical protein
MIDSSVKNLEKVEYDNNIKKFKFGRTNPCEAYLQCHCT